jgi:uncharacterized membrane protein YcgQ (UPF0703/DUF1980 family)
MSYLDVRIFDHANLLGLVQPWLTWLKISAPHKLLFRMMNFSTMSTEISFDIFDHVNRLFDCIFRPCQQKSRSTFSTMSMSYLDVRIFDHANLLGLVQPWLTWLKISAPHKLLFRMVNFSTMSTAISFDIFDHVNRLFDCIFRPCQQKSRSTFSTMSIVFPIFDHANWASFQIFDRVSSVEMSKI